MILVSRNCRGLAQAAVGRALWAFITTYNPDCVFLLETKLKENHTASIVHRSSFSLFAASPPIGSRGGLLFLWSPNVPVTVLSYSQWMINVFLYLDLPQQSFLLTLAYGPSRCSDKHHFWDSLHSISASHSKALLLIGDFNSIIS